MLVAHDQKNAAASDGDLQNLPRVLFLLSFPPSNPITKSCAADFYQRSCGRLNRDTCVRWRTARGEISAYLGANEAESHKNGSFSKHCVICQMSRSITESDGLDGQKIRLKIISDQSSTCTHQISRGSASAGGGSAGSPPRPAVGEPALRGAAHPHSARTPGVGVCRATPSPHPPRWGRGDAAHTHSAGACGHTDGNVQENFKPETTCS
jgi:hypothetical protein